MLKAYKKAVRRYLRTAFLRPNRKTMFEINTCSLVKTSFFAILQLFRLRRKTKLKQLQTV